MTAQSIFPLPKGLNKTKQQQKNETKTKKSDQFLALNIYFLV